MALLAGVVTFLARPAFDATPSLYRDDAWTALVTKTDGLSEFLLVAVTAPGFAALLKGWLALVGFDEWKAQLLPLLIAIVTPPVLYVVLVRRGLVRVAAGAGAFLLAVSPEFVKDATRVKQYSLDTLCVVCLLGLAWWLLDDVTSARRWRYLALAGVGALLLSSPSVIFLVTGLGVGLVALWREDRSRLRIALVPSALAGAFTLLWWVLVLHPAVSPALTSFWRGYYIPLGGGVGQALAAVSVTAGRVATHATGLRGGEVAAALFAVAYGVVLWRRLLLGLLLLGPIAIAFLLATRDLAPLGTGRTDVYLYPALMMAVAVTVDALARRAPRATGVGALAAAVLLLFLAPTPVYPVDEVGPLVAEVEAKASPSDAIVAYPLASYQVALYTRRPIDLRRIDTTATGFTVDVRAKNVYTPAEAWPRDALNFAATIERVRRGHDSVWVLVTPTGDPLISPPSPEGAGARERFRHRWEDAALPYALQAIRQAYGAKGVPAEPREITFQQYVGRVMRRAGYRQSDPGIVRPRGSLTHWER
ncbi:MAG: glycosyltransferase family 39 protein [Actinobacteria bacterium]|nr:glycosyltransferase family 39 protein [Actinomycetota bacterium]